MKEAVERFVSDEEAKEEEKRILNERWEAFQLTDLSITQEQVEAQVAEIIASNTKKSA